MTKALYLHGFLGEPDDMSPLFLEDYNCESVDVRQFLDKPNDLIKQHPGPYDYSVAYSYGGRLLAKCLELNPNFVKKPLFCSTRITDYTEEELKKREDFKKILLGKLESSYIEFMSFWSSLPLFDGHNMSDYRKKYGIRTKPWEKSMILSFLNNHFTYRAPKLKGFEDQSWFLFGGNDQKYKKEILKLKMNHYEFLDLGHRFLFEDPELFKNTLKTRILK